MDEEKEKDKEKENGEYKTITGCIENDYGFEQSNLRNTLLI